MIPEPSSSQHASFDSARDFISRPPPLSKIEFPKFDGDNPRLWCDHCEMFFEVYSVGDHLKTRFAALNFSGAAAAWLQTAEHRGRELNWDKFCQAVFDRFDRDQYQLHLRQLDNLR